MKVFIAAHQTISLVNFRGELIRALAAEGHEVVCCGPEPDENGKLKALGAKFIQLSFDRTGTNPLKDIGLIRSYRRILEQERPDVLLSYAIKPNVYSPRAARKAGVKRVVSIIEGMGITFSDQASLRGKLVAAIGRWLYRRSLRQCDKVIFLNTEGRDFFLHDGYVLSNQAVIVSGTGINTDYYAQMPLPESPVFLMISRLIREKGVMEYLEASRLLRQRGSGAACYLLGPYESRFGALTAEDIAPYIEDGSVEYLGVVNDVRPILEMASVVVLPSYYPEGLPRSLLEALSCGRAIITTDTPGCRELIMQGETGLFVPAVDAVALADAMDSLVHNTGRIQAMGEAGRKLCSQQYEVGKINRMMMDIMGLH